MPHRDRQAGHPFAPPTDRSSLYDEAVEAFGAAIERLAGSYELDAHKRQDLLQNIHLNLWRSLDRFDGLCSLRTWVYRVAHNVAATHAMAERRRRSRPLVGLDDLDIRDVGIEPNADRSVLLSRLMELISAAATAGTGDRHSLPRGSERGGDRGGGRHLRWQRGDQDRPGEEAPESLRE